MADDAVLSVGLSAQITAFQKQLERAGLLGKDFADKLEARVQNLKLKPSASATKDLASALDLSKPAANAAKQLDALQQAASRVFSVSGGSSPFGGLTAALGGITTALATNEIIRYADAWKSAQNQLAVVGVTGESQTRVLDDLFNAAQKNAIPFGDLVTLYGRASQAAGDLGASQKQLIEFSDGVGTALKVAGTSSEAASGALLQLSQLLSSGKVHAQEFNSILEGALPIAQAAANGIDGMGGSVAKLRAAVIAGNVSSRQFFDGFLKGLPTLQAQASQSTETVAQGFVKVQNALTRYIGETDSSLGATTRLTVGLNALADNFGNVADVGLKLASVIAAALVGRSIAGMIVSLGAAGNALIRFTQAMAAARTAGGLTAALGGLGAAAGPIGAVIGVAAAGAMLYFSSTTAEASGAANTYAAALAGVKASAAGATEAVKGLANAEPQTDQNNLTGGIDKGRADIAQARAELLDFLTLLDQKYTLDTSDSAVKLRELSQEFKDNTIDAKTLQEGLYALANSNPNFQSVADGLQPMIQTLRDAIAATDILIGKWNGVKAGASPPTGITGSERTEPADRAQSAAAADYIAQQEKLNALSKAEFDLRTETLKVQKDAAAVGKVIYYDDAQRLARNNIAARDRRKDEAKASRGSTGPVNSPEDKFEINAQQYQAETDAIHLQTQTLGESTFERTKAIETAKLEAEALERLQRAKGVDAQLSDQEKAKITQLAAARAKEVAANEAAEKSLQQLKDMEQGLAGAGLDFFDGLIDGSKTFKESVDDLLKSLAKMVLQATLLGTGPLGGLFGTGTTSKGGVGGLFGSVFSSFALKDGGPIPGFSGGGRMISGPGSGTSDSILAMTSRGSPIRVSNGEFISTAATTKRYRPLLEALNHGGFPSFAAGGMPSVSDLTTNLRIPNFNVGRRDAAPSGPLVHMPITIDARGATQDVLRPLRIEIEKLRRNILPIVADGMKRRFI